MGGCCGKKAVRPGLGLKLKVKGRPKRLQLKGGTRATSDDGTTTAEEETKSTQPLHDPPAAPTPAAQTPAAPFNFLQHQLQQSDPLKYCHVPAAVPPRSYVVSEPPHLLQPQWPQYQQPLIYQQQPEQQPRFQSAVGKADEEALPDKSFVPSMSFGRGGAMEPERSLPLPRRKDNSHRSPRASVRASVRSDAETNKASESARGAKKKKSDRESVAESHDNDGSSSHSKSNPRLTF